MIRRFSLSMILLVVCACDSEGDSAGACVLGSESDPQAELFLLPTPPEAAKLQAAVKNRQQGTVNLLLAKYASKAVAGGSTCKVLETKDSFVRVTAEPSGMTGWLPKEQLRGAGE